MALKSEAPRAWQRMLSGRRLDLLDPSPLDIEIEDIAHGLARVARWNGQTIGEHPFSVAQHCLIVEMIMRQKFPALPVAALMMGLLHDGAEYVVGDMISPFKSAIGADYKRIEDRLEAAIHIRFGLAPHPTAALKKQIKQADRISAYFEAVHLAGFEATEARQLFGAPDGLDEEALPITPWSTGEAEEAFLQRFHNLHQALGA
ncbi:YfbR-like 5'-deoxynucleotidase [Cohaesibacter haloalkalitolerans]|uniref:YfbR-like 5'-deoxynucleotidase n=1 Tax=Cohaesibacter haloalkalitolerans TaxID=1162980 RepID=UPI000E6550B1|nr:HD family hydrolase [Cohaesibacter haloalkalitolerans]